MAKPKSIMDLVLEEKNTKVRKDRKSTKNSAVESLAKVDEEQLDVTLSQRDKIFGSQSQPKDHQYQSLQHLRHASNSSNRIVYADFDKHKVMPEYTKQIPVHEQAQKYQQYGSLKKVLKKKRETAITSSSIQLEPC